MRVLGVEMNEPANSQVCERADDLISFLYGELNEREARSFEQHKRTCERCAAELAAFSQVRNSVQLWRDESLHLSVGTLPQTAVAPRRSALAAIKSFFDIAPLWMKGATAVAAVLLCVLSALAGARLLDEPQPPVLSVLLKTDDEIRIEIESKANLLAQSRISTAPAIVQRPERSEQKRPANVNAGGDQTTVAKVSGKASKPLSRSERNQLAADLRLVSGDEDDSLQLLGDRINR
jgi:hypothetical protein